MDIVFDILGTWGIILFGLVLFLIAYAGSILPALPGVPFAGAAVFLVHFSLPEAEGFSWLTLSIVIILTLAISILDIIVPVLGTKKFGGSKAGVRGSTVGLIIGFLISMFTGGLGILALFAGPFLGAYIGERYVAKASNEIALASAWGSFLGFLAGTVGKLIVVTISFIIFIVGAVRLF